MTEKKVIGRPFQKGQNSFKRPPKLEGESPPKVEAKKPIKNDLKEVDDESLTVAQIDFLKEKNTLSIVLRKKKNRAYRVQIFLNNKYEITPSTFWGCSEAFERWNLLKELTKDEP